jgi:hypothetical protein
MDREGSMDATIYCLVDSNGRVHLKDGARSYADVAATDGLNESECQQYRFDLATRRLLTDRATPSSGRAAKALVANEVGTPERLIKFAGKGHLPKHVLASLLSTENRHAYLEACAAIEKKFTEACTAKNDPCLESGCSLEGEVCLEALMVAGAEYHQACAAEWIQLFKRPTNRIDAWKN